MIPANFTPYEYQKRIAHLLLVEKRNVILQAPTGAGKTHAALLPFLNALEHNRDFPQRCIYSVPMRVLANQFVEKYRESIKRAGRSNKVETAIQTGEQPEDPLFTANLIFATIDQTLSSYLLAPYSLSRGKANLNAGAVLSSYLVFDEFHLYDPDSTLPTTLHMLKMFRGITPFILMTATFSSHMLTALADELDAVIVPASEAERAEFAKLASQQKQRFYHVADEPLSAKAVLDKHTGRSLVICNTVDRARALHGDIRKYASPDTKVILLHSRFLGDDRNTIEGRIRKLFGQGNQQGSYIVVATQAIEVGVDITSTVLHTELAPANAIIQRAGRCARYPGETGHVYIYQHSVNPDDPDNPVDLGEKTVPYEFKGAKDLFTYTLEAVRDYGGSTSLDFEDEQAIITAVHGRKDEQVIAQLKQNEYNYSKDMASLLRGEKRSDWRHFIRIMNQQQVTIHPSPDELLERPYDVPSFGLYSGTLQGYIKKWLERWNNDASIPWAVKWLKEDTDPDAEQANKTLYSWKEIRDDPGQAWGAKLVVVHPRLATYDPELGFIPDAGGTRYMQLPEKKSDGQRDSAPRYRLETYADHIRHVYEAFEEQHAEMLWAARRLEARFQWEAGSVMKAARLAILLHDVGKLSVGWQGWVREYQAKIGMGVKPGEAYAHTELQNDEHREIERSMKRRPWHAVEGAVATVPAVITALNDNEDLTKAVFSAIARHHAPHSDNHQPFRLVKNALQHIRATFQNRMPVPDLNDLIAGADAEEVYQWIADPDSEPAAFLAYLLLVRALRRADVAGTMAGSGKARL